MPCFARGTLLRTPEGESAVERIGPGDLLSLHSGGAGRVVWVGHRRIDCDLHPHAASVWPVRVRADAFGPGLPDRDVVLSPDHALFMDGVLIPVRLLADGGAVVQERWSSVEYWHVELERHDVVLAHGLPVESFLDAVTRDALIGDGDGPPAIRLHPIAPAADAAVRAWEGRGCAPLVVAGPALDRARARLAPAMTRAA